MRTVTSVVRDCRYSLPCDTSLFTPLQLQPVMAGRIANTAIARWLCEHLVSYRRLLTEYRTGLVVWSVRIRYERPLRFDDADELQVRVAGRARHGGRQMEWETCIGAGAEHTSAVAVRVHLVTVPVRLDGDPSLSAQPAPLGPELLGRFPEDETRGTPHLSPVPGLRRSLESADPPLARSASPFLIHRAACEVADQWAWTELIALAAAGRERLILDHGQRLPPLRAGLRHPLRSLDAQLSKPCHLFDQGEIASGAWQRNPHLAFTHLVRSRGNNHAVVVEQC